MGDENQPPVTVNGGASGDGVYTGYSVDHDSASLAAEATAAEVPAIATASTAVEDAMSAAEQAFPSEFADAIARIKALRESHVADLTTVHTFAEGCVSSVRSCLAVYETTSAEQVAETARYEKKLVFEHPSLFGMTQIGVNRSIDSGLTMPSSDEGTRREYSRGFTSTNNDSGQSTTTTTTSTRAGNGTTTTATNTYEYAHNNSSGVTTSEQTYSARHSSNGVTDTTTYYNGTSHRGGNNESTASGRSYSVADGDDVATTTEGDMAVPR